MLTLKKQSRIIRGYPRVKYLPKNSRKERQKGLHMPNHVPVWPSSMNILSCYASYKMKVVQIFYRPRLIPIPVKIGMLKQKRVLKKAELSGAPC